MDGGSIIFELDLKESLVFSILDPGNFGALETMSSHHQIIVRVTRTGVASQAPSEDRDGWPYM